MEELSIAKLPKESRLVITLSGRTLSKPDNQSGNNTAEKDKNLEIDINDSSEKHNNELNHDPNFVKIEQEELGWASIQLIDFDGYFFFFIILNCYY